LTYTTLPNINWAEESFLLPKGIVQLPYQRLTDFTQLHAATQVSNNHAGGTIGNNEAATLNYASRI
jgi:hypothetical protein